jgi:sulfotransferase family protein
VDLFVTTRDLESAGIQFLIIIGSMKSGTSALFEYLRRHPQIGTLPKKATDYFLNNDISKHDLLEYKAKFDYDPTQHRFAMEASPNYTKLRFKGNCANNILNSGIRAKFIYIMRDPIKRIESQIQHSLDLGWDKPPRKWMRYDPHSADVDDHMIEPSRYATQLREYYSRFPREDILLLKFEDLISEPSRVVAATLDFLHLDKRLYPGGQFQVVNSSEQRSSRLPPLIKRVMRFSLMRELTSMAPQSAKTFIKRLWKKPRNVVRLNEQRREFVLDILQPEIEEIRCRYQFDVSGWECQTPESTIRASLDLVR